MTRQPPPKRPPYQHHSRKQGARATTTALQSSHRHTPLAPILTNSTPYKTSEYSQPPLSSGLPSLDLYPRRTHLAGIVRHLPEPRIHPQPHRCAPPRSERGLTCLLRSLLQTVGRECWSSRLALGWLGFQDGDEEGEAEYGTQR